MNFKQKIYQYYLQRINEKISLQQQTLNGLKEAGANETKSTAGDKHETALAMLQIEQENIRRQLKEANEQLVQFLQLENIGASSIVIRGSLVKTNKGYLYMSIALGKLIVDGIMVIALSPQSPLGSRLMGCKTGDTIAINEISYIIEDME